MYDSFVRQLNYYGFRKALRNTNRYVVMDRSIESPDDFRFLNRYIPSHALRPAADPIREVKARTVAREKLDATAPPASLDEAVLATETKRSAPKQIYDPSVERKKPQHGSSSSRKRSRTPTPS